MKKIYLILTIWFFALGGNLLQAQNPFWTFPKEYWKYEGPGLLPSSQTATFSHAGILDPYGEIMFYKVDEYLLDKDGVEMNQFMGHDYSHITGSAETLIVPQPGSCDRFYIFQAGQIGGQDDELPHFSTYVHSEREEGGLLEADNIFGNAFNLEGNLIEPWHQGSQHAYRGIHFAATKERPEGVRWIFISNSSDIYRVDLTCDTLEATGWKYRFNPGPINYRFGWRNELEIYEDASANLIRVAVPYHNSTPSGYIHVAVFDLDADDGSLVPGSRKTIDFFRPCRQFNLCSWSRIYT